MDVAQVLKGALLYIGNDSGLLHLANLVQTPSFGVYLATTPDAYTPLFSHLNHPIIRPQNLHDLWSAIEHHSLLQPV